MQQNTTHCDNLSTAQQMALNALLVGQNMTQAASAAGVDRSTLHRWFRDDLEFVAAVNRGKRDLHEAMQARLLAMTEKAVDSLEISIENGNEKSAWMLLKGVGLLSGEPPIIGSDDLAELEAEKERENLVKIMSRPF